MNMNMNKLNHGKRDEIMSVTEQLLANVV